jgi:hypothetical protein
VRPSPRSTGAAAAKWWLTEQQRVVVDRCVQLIMKEVIARTL